MDSHGRLPEFHSCTSLPPGHFGEPLLIAVHDQQVLCTADGEQLIFPPSQLAAQDYPRHLLGLLDGRPCYAVDFPLEGIPRELAWFRLRSLLGDMDEPLFNLAGRACQLVQWDRQHRYCGRCGRPTESSEGDRSKCCDHCNELFYPRLSPCVIVVISRGDHCLLASSSRWQGGFYSALAGFIEPGETAEEALHREVMEEVGIRVTNLRYFSSQPWPFPGQLMLGFHANYLAGEIRVDGEEISAADWYHYEQLPPHPDARTLSGRLIQHFVAGCRGRGVV
ncbi:NAD(+) diphosphatase [Porticoccus sp.]